MLIHLISCSARLGTPSLLTQNNEGPRDGDEKKEDRSPEILGNEILKKYNACFHCVDTKKVNKKKKGGGKFWPLRKAKVLIILTVPESMTCLGNGLWPHPRPQKSRSLEGVPGRRGY